LTQSCRYEMMLGHLGAILITQDARRIAITDEGAFLSVSWQNGSATRERGFFSEAELSKLHSASLSQQTAEANRLALLAALGRHLDQRGLDVSAIEEKTDTFAVSGVASGKYTKQLINHRELVGSNRSEPARASAIPAAWAVPTTHHADDDATLTDANPRFPALRTHIPASPPDGTASPLRRRLRLS
jgi:hypothetical protein